MFFEISKIGGFFVQPSNLLVLSVVAGIVLLFTRRRRMGRAIAAVAGTLLILAGFSPAGNWLVLPLEQRFSPPPIDAPPPKGIVVLMGSISTLVAKGRGEAALNESAERLTATVALARLYPTAKLVLSGGSGNLLYSGANESQVARGLLISAGVAADRIQLEDRSRNTFENALYSKNMIDPQDDERWLLVTSAFHMPRAMGCFRRVGFEVVPYPVDYRTQGNADVFRPFVTAAEGLRRIDLAVREWTGLVAYRLTGRTSALLPSP